jgi:tRNA modification GTPase
MYIEDTIAAVATPAGEGGVAIVRVSGPEAERIGHDIFQRRGSGNGRLQSHMLHHGTISDPKNGMVLDDVLMTLMRGPHSYTGENVLEVHCHGGSFVARQILETVLNCGARHAEPGEFTKRAFLNGRLDLAQAEGVLDLIHARTEKGMQLAVGQVRGELSKWVEELREELVGIMVQVEAAIDFPEEELELLKRDELAGNIDSLMRKISIIIDSYDWGRLFREGVKVCIAGRPNVGKSSLLNALLGEERVIVTPVPGTTRDFIEESLNLNGLRIVLWDTAGIREGRDEVERLGVGFSMKKLEEAQGFIFVLDGSLPLTQEDRAIMAQVRGKKGIVVVNKSDLPNELSTKELKCLAPNHEIVAISAKKGDRINELKKTLRSCFLGDQPEPEIVVTNLRHKTALEKSATSLLEASKSLRGEMPPEMVAVDLQETNQHLGEVIGIVTNDDILERVFSQFCIGK